METLLGNLRKVLALLFSLSLMELSFLSMANNDNTKRESEILYLLLFIIAFYSSLNLSKMLTIFFSNWKRTDLHSGHFNCYTLRSTCFPYAQQEICCHLLIAFPSFSWPSKLIEIRSFCGKMQIHLRLVDNLNASKLCQSEFRWQRDEQSHKIKWP